MNTINAKIRAHLALTLIWIAGGCTILEGTTGNVDAPVDRGVISETVQIQGSIAYASRAGLPEGAEITVSVLDVTRSDTFAFPVASKSDSITSVPYDFALKVPRTALGDGTGVLFHAEIRDRVGRLLWTSDENIGGLSPDPFSAYVDVGRVILVSGP